MFQFSRLNKVPEFGKQGSFFKADLEIVFKNLQRKYECVYLDIYAFFEAIEKLSEKVYKDQEEMTFGDKIKEFIERGVEFFEELVEQQNEERQEQVTTSAKTKGRKM